MTERVSRASGLGVAFSYRQTMIVKGMLARGDKQHDIAAYFGVNGGRVAEVSTGNCDYPNAPVAPDDKLPPAGPYVGLKSVAEIVEILEEAIAIISEAGDASEEANLAIEALSDALGRIR